MKWLKSLGLPGIFKNTVEPGQRTPEQLRADNERLIAELREVVTTAAENEEIWRHFMEIERLLLRSREFEPLTRSLIREIKGRFSPDLVILYLTHPELLERFFPNLAATGEQIEEGAWIRPWPLAGDRSPTDDFTRPCWLGEAAVGALLPARPAASPAVRSAVLVPLTVHALVFGSLLLGSRDPERYGPNDGTELLEQLGSKIALCMDNCLAYERAKELSDQDHLTGLLNFFQIHTVLEREFRQARRTDSDLAVLVMELDFVEETGDHLDMAGPVLRHVANLLRAQFPDGGGFIGRYGSHEFMIVMPYARPEQAMEVAENLSRLIRRSPLRQGNAVVLIRPRIGVAAIGEHMSRPHDLLDSAMNQLYQAKAATRPTGTNGPRNPG